MAIKRRKHSKVYVYYDNGHLVIKTPATVTGWPDAFRFRIVRDYIPPRTLKSASEYTEHILPLQGTVYKINGAPVKVLQPFEALTKERKLVVLRTEVVNLQTKQAMFLNHDEPAMRMLAVYSFLYNEPVAGCAQMSIYDL